MDRRTVGKKRLDAFVDGAFAFSATLLAVGNAPAMQSFDDVITRFAHVPAFGLSLLVIMSFWWAHRQYGNLVVHDDMISNIVSIFIMFLVMVFVFPLGFLSESFLHWLSEGILPGVGLNAAQMEDIYLLFGGGFILLSAAYAFLYWHVLNDRINRRFPSVLLPATKIRFRNWLLCIFTGFISVVAAQLAPIDSLIWLPMLPYIFLIIGLFLMAIIRILKKYKMRGYHG